MPAPRYIPLSRATWRRLINQWRVPRTKLVIEEYLLGHVRSLLALVQSAFVRLFNPVPAQTVFVLGFWRSGTTLLHELLSVDDHFCFPSTFDCFNAHSFVLTSPLARFRSKEVVRRPQDGMKTGWSTPQEDEFALLSLGARSPYEGLLAPKSLSPAMELADPNDLNPSERRYWKRTFMSFLQNLTLVYGGKPILLKSPAHGYRLQSIRQLLPEAKFIVVVRNPHDVLASWLATYASFTRRYGIGGNLPDDEVCEITHRERLRYEEKLTRGLMDLPSEQFLYVRYEDLIADPIAAIEAIYIQLGLSGFELMLPKLRHELSKRSGYVRHTPALNQARLISTEIAWRALFERYGYTLTQTPPASAPSLKKAS